MTGIAVVASTHDAKFAEEVRAALQAAGLDASVSQSLPKATGPHVVLIWSAALEAGHAIDAQALIGLWSDERLVIARRDETPLPLGLRDLPSLGPDKSAADVCAALPAPGSSAKPSSRSSLATVFVSVVVVAAIGGGAYYYLTSQQREKQAALTAALESATKASQELQQAQDGAASAKKAATKTEVAAAAPVAKAPEAKAPLVEVPKGAPEPMAKSAPEQDALYQQAMAMEQEGRAAESVRIYRRAARAGSGKAAKRLGEIYDRGVTGVSRDYAESLQWYETARQLGETVETAGRRDGGPAVAPGPAKSATAVTPKSAPPKLEEPVAAAEPRPAPAPPPAPVAIPEPPKAAAPAPSPAPAPETKTGWFSMRGLLIASLVLALIAWRRSRRREKAAAKRAQRRSGATADEIVPILSEKAAARRAAPQGDSMLFVSYSHKDRPRVEPIVSVIEEMGRRVWMDRTDITGQTGWAGQIVRAIRECRAVVLMASPNSYTSDQVVRELYLAMNHRKTIVPIEIEPAEMPDELQYILAPFQHHRLSGRETREVLGRALAAV